jgi:hypothetical protein
MADDTTRPPTLPSTADTTAYAPVSWMAVASVVVTTVFVLVLVLSALDAWWHKKPLVMPEVFFLPAVAIVLAFAARRMIRNSEGTRVGDGLANAAWWTSLVLALIYFAYLLAVGYSVRRDAEAEVVRWVGYLKEGDVIRAFDRTLPPKDRVGGDAARMQTLHREQLHQFRQSDIVRLMDRNMGDWRFEPGGLRDWRYMAWGVDALAGGTVKCAEGTFPLAIPMKAVEGVTGSDGGPAGRQWQIMMHPGQTYIARDQVARTRYGWTVLELERQGSRVGREFIQRATSSYDWPILAYIQYVHKDQERDFALLTEGGKAARTAAVGPLGGVLAVPASYYDTVADRLFVVTGKPAPTEDERKRLRVIWQKTGVGLGMLPGGARLRGAGENPDLVTITDTAVEVRVAADLIIPGPDEMSAARARVVVATSDPALLSELKQMRAKANPDDTVDQVPEDIKTRQFTGWRVVRIETDLVPVRLAPPGRGDAAGGM